MNTLVQSRQLVAPQALQGLVIPQQTPLLTDGSILSIVAALDSGQFGTFRWDGYRHCEIWEIGNSSSEIKDAEITRLITQLQLAGFRKVSRRDFIDALHMVAKGNQYDSAIAWLDTLQWDRQPRIETFFPDHLGTNSGPYELALGRYMWTGLAARFDYPGCKADMVPTLVGPEGCRKHDLLKAIAPSPEHYTEVCLTDRDILLTRKFQGRAIVVWKNRRGIRNSNDAEKVRALISNTADEAYSRHRFGMSSYERRCMIFSTSLTDEILYGLNSRRDLPIQIGKTIDIDRVERVKDQLWAEARHVIRQRVAANLSPVDYEDAERLAKSVHGSFAKQARWLGDRNLHNWLATGVSKFTAEDALLAIGFTSDQITNVEKRHMCTTLRQLGYSLASTRVPGSPNSYQRWSKK